MVEADKTGIRICCMYTPKKSIIIWELLTLHKEVEEGTYTFLPPLLL